MSILRIYFSARWRDAASDCPWALCDDSGAVAQSGTGTLASMPKASECIGVLASDRVLCSEVDMPTGARRRWIGALPFLAEEHTVSDPEDNHVVPGPSSNKQKLALLVANKSWLRQIADACRAANVPLRKVVPEFALPAVADDAWTLVWDGESGFLCTAPGCGIALDAGNAELPPLALRLLLEANPAPDKIELRYTQRDPQAQKTLPQWPGIAPALSLGQDWDWRNAPIPAGAPNLLWGELAPPARPLEWWPKLRPAAMLLLAMLGVEMLGTNLQWALLSYEKSSLTRSMEQSFRQAFGSTATVVNAPLQMQRNLADLRHGSGAQDDGDFLLLINSASRTLASLPAGSIRDMHYESGRLDMQIKLNNLSEAAALQSKLQDNGMTIRSDIKDTGNGVNVRLTWQHGAAI